MKKEELIKDLVKNYNRLARAARARLPGVDIATIAAGRIGSREEAARHEAGHVLVSALVGGAPLWAFVPRTPLVGGSYDGAASCPTHSPRQAAMMSVAGAVAQRVPWLTPLDALVLASAIAPFGTTYPEVAQEVCRLFTDVRKLLAGHSRCIEALSGAILHHKMLDRAHICQILKAHGLPVGRATRRQHSESHKFKTAVLFVAHKLTPSNQGKTP